MAPATGSGSGGLSADEKAAVRDRAAEARAAKARKGEEKAAADAADCLAAIEKMPEPDRSLAERVAGLVRETAPALEPKTWYGMPAWSLEGKTLLYFKNASKFKERYSTLGFTDAARLDDGRMWAKEFAVLSIGGAEAGRIADLIRQAVGL